MHSLHVLRHGPRAKIVVFYPAKVLANDQFLRWKSAADLAGIDPSIIQQFTGDTAMRQRITMLATASIVLMTPDIAHAWLLCSSAQHSVRDFLAHLRLIVTDEAHVYEDVLGTNAAFLVRRIVTAAARAGNSRPPQHIAATATIQDPASHL